MGHIEQFDSTLWDVYEHCDGKYYIECHDTGVYEFVKDGLVEIKDLDSLQGLAEEILDFLHTNNHPKDSPEINKGNYRGGIWEVREEESLGSPLRPRLWVWSIKHHVAGDVDFRMSIPPWAGYESRECARMSAKKVLCIADKLIREARLSGKVPKWGATTEDWDKFSSHLSRKIQDLIFQR